MVDQADDVIAELFGTDPRRPVDSDTTWRSRLRKVQLGAKTYFVAEGDLLLEAEDLDAYLRRWRNEQRAAAQTFFKPLVVMTKDERPVRWRPGRLLTYRVVRSSFPNDATYDAIVNNAAAAARAWEDVCGVEFVHQRELDGASPDAATDVLFSFGFVRTGGEFLAVAFFPSDPPDRRQVFIDESYFDEHGFDRVGILRHELGHVLGFRHEHIRGEAPPSCRGEDPENSQAVTKYDPASVMHYFCGNAGSKTLELTAVDIVGAVAMYGPPLRQFDLVE